MRVMFNVVDPRRDQRADVVLDADAGTRVSDVATRLNAVVRGDVPVAAPDPAVAGGARSILTAPSMRLAERAPGRCSSTVSGRTPR